MPVPGELTIRIAGAAGQGMQSVGDALGKVFRQAGLNIFATQDFMSRIRGGNNFFQLRVSISPVYTLRQKCDILVALDKEGQSDIAYDVAMQIAAANPKYIRPEDVDVAELSKEKELTRAFLRQAGASQAIDPFQGQQLIQANTQLLKQHQMQQGVKPPQDSKE